MRSTPGHGMTDHHVKAEAYAACVHLERFDECDVWCDERHEVSPAFCAGTIHIDDMRHVWRADIIRPFNVVNFYVPQSAIDEIVDDENISHVEELRCSMSTAHVDDVFTNLALAILPALAKPDHTSRLFVDHVARTVAAHLITNYGSHWLRPPFGSGGLAPWQERRAKEMLRGDLSGNFALQDLAKACRLSSSHFSQAFKLTMGCPPHQWLLGERVERAKQLMLNTPQPLSEIALASGFADQSHFTRVFSQRIKVSPAAWRREHAR
jgi:AraC-like DNA-binding protein